MGSERDPGTTPGQGLDSDCSASHVVTIGKNRKSDDRRKEEDEVEVEKNVLMQREAEVKGSDEESDSDSESDPESLETTQVCICTMSAYMSTCKFMYVCMHVLVLFCFCVCAPLSVLLSVSPSDKPCSLSFRMILNSPLISLFFFSVLCRYTLSSLCQISTEDLSEAEETASRHSEEEKEVGQARPLGTAFQPLIVWGI